jgi:hypothetical protein
MAEALDCPKEPTPLGTIEPDLLVDETNGRRAGIIYPETDTLGKK